MTRAETDKAIYLLAKNYLLNLEYPEVTSVLLEKYLTMSTQIPRPESLSGIYQRLLESAQNANMRSGVIGKAIGGVDRLGGVLFNFDPLGVLGKFSEGWEVLLDEIEKTLAPSGKIRRTPRSIWPKYCQTILSAAEFLVQFSSAEDFYNWVEYLYVEDNWRAAIPLIIEKEVTGIGFALACDFLKELGYINFAKPDVHLRNIFTALELCPPGTDDYGIFKAIVRVAKNAEVSPYNADRVFWLIGSGYFYNDPHIGNNGRIGRQKDKFISFASRELRLKGE